MSEIKQEGMRFDQQKLRPELIPIEWIVELSRVFTVGAMKYDDNNWLKGMAWPKVEGSMDRHILKWKNGEDVDHETKCLHLAQVAWNALALMSYYMRGIGADPRSVTLYDENLNPLEGTPAGDVGVGMSQEELSLLRKQYDNLRSLAK